MDRKLDYIKKLIKNGLPKSEVIQRFEKRFGEWSNASVLYNSVISSEFLVWGRERQDSREFACYFETF
ncbi:hypothetical protein [Leadbettera azotonutricia]|uniref:Uncharacterized protein n=1 Tax=Leadbettera azotonutricia (strain ATCC BAA-888 / DSM 13862 / ZAS-9) TaxID=545695 RepID=F5YAL3_LEAAZ|nr:hypothetical protein [Leadbettera azotonutricia]AEF82834.1 hypothetical protein TREAZ_1997 [Leadbettera azotonutricia ZAS-9]